MLKPPKRLAYEVLILGAFALGSCDMPQSFRTSDADKLDVADVNARNAIYRVNKLERRVSEIESKLNM